VTVVVISSGEKGDRLVGSLEVRVPVAGRVLVTPLERQSRRAPLPTKACQYHRTIRPLRSQVLLSSKGGRNTKEGVPNLGGDTLSGLNRP